ncbi:hypothetical protein SteCoe_15972 [Stentor coeruleus]|uniref:Uncharacterized protein n=1 Tax=Stentor coeruleus TaxID=5963 RepID=A0A1R2C2I6_9CILI|nr:hypothetical protein SteCoe_15972 [Stentor coeruleus]
MGCQETKESKKNLSAGSLQSTENHLNFNYIPSKKLDLLLHRYSYSSIIPEKNLLKVVSLLSLDFKANKDFYDMFKKSKKTSNKETLFCARKICTLGIIYGSSSEHEKIKLLFQNYDKNTLNALTSKEIEILVLDVIYIVLKAIPSFSMLLYPMDSELFKLVKTFNMTKDYIKDIIINCIMNETDEVNYKAFLKSFEGQEVKFLIYPNELRKYCIRIEKKIKSMKKRGNLGDDIEDNFEKSCHKKLILRKKYTVGIA